MNNTALRAEAQSANNKHMVFNSEEHEKFYYEKLEQARYQDCYHKALIYILGISEDTRNHFSQIYDIKSGFIKPECLHQGWQTSGSVRVVRLAFNLYTDGTPSVDDYKRKDEQMLVINGVLLEHDDEISSMLYKKQQDALSAIPEELKELSTYQIPLRAYNIAGLENVRSMLSSDRQEVKTEVPDTENFYRLRDVIKSIDEAGRKVVFTIANRGKKVHLTTTDPAAHLKFVLEQAENITMSHIDEHAELKKYQEEVLSKARANGLSEEDIAYIEEDLRSPCTQEIAVFRAFAEIVEKADDQIVVIDTAPTGHTLLLLESTESYDKEIQRTKGETPESVKRLLPRLKSAETEVVIVTLPEATPVYEALRLEDDLNRAQIAANWWVINQSFYHANTTNSLLEAKASNEVEWINRIDRHSDGKFAVIAWSADQIKGEKLLEL